VGFVPRAGDLAGLVQRLLVLLARQVVGALCMTKRREHDEAGYLAAHPVTLVPRACGTGCPDRRGRGIRPPDCGRDRDRPEHGTHPDAGDRVLVRRARVGSVSTGQIVVVESPTTGTGGKWTGESARHSLGRNWMIKRVTAIPGEPRRP
jgi:hypothetical protein